MSDYLPKDVLVEILSKLPLKKVIQCTSVCKSWYAAIANPNFISVHYNTQIISNSSRRPLLFVRHYNMYDRVERYALHFDDEHEGEEDSSDTDSLFDQYLELKCPERSRNEYLRIVGCCNGLICLSDDYDKYTDTVVLWNPIIRKHLKLPSPNLGYNGRGSCYYGFGFDVVKNDYKVVRVVYNSTATEDYMQFPPTIEFLDRLRAVKFLVPPAIEVYSLKSGIWRSISGGVPSYILHQNHSVSTYLNGAIHWIASKSSDDDDGGNGDSNICSSSSGGAGGSGKDGSFIVALDVGTENFSELGLPDSVAERNVMKLDVMVMGTSLALVEYEKFWQSDYCWIWVMKEYGVVKSWTRLHNIDLRGGFRNIVGFRTHGELLISARMVGMVSYNPKKRNISYLGIHGTNRSFHGEPFFESLALVGKEDRFVDQATSSTDVVQEVGSTLYFGGDGTEQQTQ